MRRALVLAALLGVVALPARAGRIEEAFRGFLERLRAEGRGVDAWRDRLGFREIRVPELAPRVDQLPLGRQDYAVFVTAGCAGCTQAVAFMRQRGLAMEVLDVTRSATAREAYALTGGQGFPLVLVGKQRLTGWSERLFKDALRNEVQDVLQRQQGQGA